MNSIAIVRQQVGDTFRPFDDEHAVAFEVLFESECYKVLNPLQAVEVGVEERDPAGVFEDVVERRRDDFIRYTESTAHAAGDNGFPCSEFTAQTDDIARAKPLCKRLSPGESLFYRPGDQPW